MALALFYFLSAISLLPNIQVLAVGTSSTAAVVYGTSTVCGIVAAEPTRRIKCFRGGLVVLVQPDVSFAAVSGGESFFCGLTSSGYTLLCWDTGFSRTSFQPKRIYHSNSIPLTDLAVGNDHVCAREVNSGEARCWRGATIAGAPFPSPEKSLNFKTITSGDGFSCGISRKSSNVICWGHNAIGNEIQSQFNNVSMATIVAGESRVCGLTTNGVLLCTGTVKLDIPSSSYEFSSIAIGDKFVCAVGETTGELSCWGETDEIKTSSDPPLEFIIAGLNFICGLKTSNLTIICWGNGWPNSKQQILPLGTIIPGSCVRSSCGLCGLYPNSDTLCHGSGYICKACKSQLPLPVPLPPVTPSFLSNPSRKKDKLNWAFLVVGSFGAFVGFCFLLHCSIIRFRRTKKHSVIPASVQAAMDLNNPAFRTSRNASNEVWLSSMSGKRSSSRTLQRDRSRSTGQSGGTVKWERNGSSSKHSEKTQIFTLSDLAGATNNFSPENKIGAGSFGVVYKGKLENGQEVAIKRAEPTNSTNSKTKKLIEMETAFDSELALLSRLHHKHLVGLLGFCEENDERLLVYEHMKNGSLHDHLHNKKNSDIELNSWKIRIKVALDAARGVDYLHNYAVPSIIHRDIKSSNILIDSNWTARVSDFGLSLMGPESDQNRFTTRAVGTIGYIDPEYYVSNVLTSKSDVYGFGVVLLELLTGKKAVFKEEKGKVPIGLVEFAVPRMLGGEMVAILDKRIGRPDLTEKEAVELFAYTAMHCVSYEGKERPAIIDVVAHLERALELCQDNRLSFSSPSD